MFKVMKSTHSCPGPPESFFLPVCRLRAKRSNHTIITDVSGQNEISSQISADVEGEERRDKSRMQTSSLLRASMRHMFQGPLQVDEVDHILKLTL